MSAMKPFTGEGCLLEPDYLSSRWRGCMLFV
jgi:hypothetical protein